MKKITRLLTLTLLIPLVSCGVDSSVADSESQSSLPPISETSNDNVSSEDSLDINYPLVHFNATSPIDVPANAKIKLAGHLMARIQRTRILRSNRLAAVLIK